MNKFFIVLLINAIDQELVMREAIIDVFDAEIVKMVVVGVGCAAAPCGLIGSFLHAMADIIKQKMGDLEHGGLMLTGLPLSILKDLSESTF